MKRFFVFLPFFLIGGLLGYLLSGLRTPGFKKLGLSEKWQRIIQERDYAINEAVEVDVYRCCISPPCTMCYMEANQWNNYQTGTCACDDLIAQGEEPCPQCERGLCASEGACKLDK